jgi:hypothetical protein
MRKTKKQKKSREELLATLCKQIREVITSFSKDNYEQYSNFEASKTKIETLDYQDFIELSECVELSTRALAFELGYNKQMLKRFPENSVDKMIVDEMFFGKQCFENEFKIALKMTGLDIGPQPSTPRKEKKDYYEDSDEDDDDDKDVLN